MLINKLQRLGQRGDTIIEVLIAVTVISMVLGGAYVATNRNIQTSRNTEEQSSALKLAESQVEQIKGLINRDPAQVFDTSHATFCIFEGAVYASTNNNCLVDLRGKPSAAQPQYRLNVTESSNLFTVNVQWDQLGGNQGNLRMLYRAHE